MSHQATAAPATAKRRQSAKKAEPAESAKVSPAAAAKRGSKAAAAASKRGSKAAAAASKVSTAAASIEAAGETETSGQQMAERAMPEPVAVAAMAPGQQMPEHEIKEPEPVAGAAEASTQATQVLNEGALEAELSVEIEAAQAEGHSPATIADDADDAVRVPASGDEVNS